MIQRAGAKVQFRLSWGHPACSTCVSPTSKPYPFFSHLLFLPASSTFCPTSPCCWASTLQHCPSLLEDVICALTPMVGAGAVPWAEPTPQTILVLSFPPLGSVPWWHCQVSCIHCTLLNAGYFPESPSSWRQVIQQDSQLLAYTEKKNNK